MTIKHRPRIGLRSALVALIVASVVPFGLLLHFTWWRTATKVSHDLVDTLERQITDSVRRTWWGRVLEVQGLSQVVSEAAAVPGGPLTWSASSWRPPRRRRRCPGCSTYQKRARFSPCRNSDRTTRACS